MADRARITAGWRFLHLPSDMMTVFASFQGLRDVTVLASWYHLSRTPNFRNLETLRLIHLQKRPSMHDARRMGETIALSPQLHNLALSLRYAYSKGEPPLGEVIRTYSSERKRRQLPILGLSHLDLGMGFLPSGDPPLSMLTDFTRLRDLRLRDNADNWPTAGVWRLNIKEVFGAIHLRRLTVTNYAKQIDELLEVPGLSKSLEDIEVTRPWYYHYHWHGADCHIPWCKFYGRKFSWRRVCLSVQMRDIHDFHGRFREGCQITDLRLPTDDNTLKRIKTVIIPAFNNLEVLQFTGGKMQKRRRPG